jgi:ribosomal protein S18 acetylase RimI-like enzyme
MPEPKVVVAVGICATSGGVFRECYNISGGVDSVIPVDVYVAGCAARPEAIVDGIVQSLGVLEQKRKEMAAAPKNVDKTLYLRAEKSDAPEILGLQKTAFQSEAELYGNDSLPALQQTLEELQQEFERPQGVVLKAVVNGKIIGSVRGHAADGTAQVGRLVVHPYFQRRGIGVRLMAEIEKAFPDAKRFEVFTGEKSQRNLSLYRKLGYLPYKTEPGTPAVTLVYLQKERK